jgi:hypothetical protein
MSSTNRSAERIEADNYPTPAWCVKALLKNIHLRGGCWLEPAAGDGAIIRAVNAVRDDVMWDAVDIRRECLEQLTGMENVNRAWMGYDYLQAAPFKKPQYDVIITNPPFSHALEFVQNSIGRGVAVVMLMRLNWLSSKSRNQFVCDHTPSVYVLPRRPSFTAGGGTDSCEYAWMVWGVFNQSFIRVLPYADCLDVEDDGQEVLL